MVDDSLIRQYCSRNGLRFEWATRTEGDRAHASLRIWRGDESLFWQGTNGCYSEQALLDRLMHVAIEDIEAAPPHYVISGWKPSQ